jgi:DNA invertase Pin-like site-specific DNA recombinase
MLGAIGQFDRTRIVEKLRAARVRKRQQTGRCEGRKPYGARQGEAETIRRIVELFDAGGNFTSIATELNAENRPTRTRGSRWSSSTVAKIVRRNASAH